MKKITVLFVLILAPSLFADKKEDRLRLKGNIDSLAIISNFATTKCNEIEPELCYQKMSAMLMAVGLTIDGLESKTKAIQFLKIYTKSVFAYVLDGGPAVVANNFLQLEDQFKLSIESAQESIK